MFKRLLMGSLIIVGINTFAGVYVSIGSGVGQSDKKDGTKNYELTSMEVTETIYIIALNTETIMITGVAKDIEETYRFQSVNKKFTRTTQEYSIESRYKLTIVNSIFLAPYLSYISIKQDAKEFTWTRFKKDKFVSKVDRDYDTSTEAGVSIGYIINNNVDSYIMLSYCIDNDLWEGDHNDHFLSLEMVYRFDNKVILGAAYGEDQSHKDNFKKSSFGAIFVGWAFF